MWKEVLKRQGDNTEWHLDDSELVFFLRPSLGPTHYFIYALKLVAHISRLMIMSLFG